MWVMAVQKSRKDEILLLEKKVDEILEKPTYDLFKVNVLKFIKLKKDSLGI
jgi:hypothetical protein